MYFDNQTGVSHAIYWAKLSFQHFHKQNKDEKVQKIKKIHLGLATLLDGVNINF